MWRVDPQVTGQVDSLHDRVPRRFLLCGPRSRAPNTPCAGRIIEGTMDSRLIAVDALTGKPCAEFNGTGQQDTKIGMGRVPPGSASINSAPTIVRGIIVVPHQVLDGQCRCAPSGVIQGFDAKTGKLAWAWDMQHPEWSGYPPAGQTWTEGRPTAGRPARATRSSGSSIVPTRQCRRRLHFDGPDAARER